MFYKSENPALFERIVEKYNTICDMHAGEMITEETKGLYNKVDSSCEKLEQSQLDLITSLHIDGEYTSGLTSLAGIEKLTNLKVFRLYGVSTISLQDYVKSAREDGKEVSLQSLQNKYNQCQITDLSPLYKCKKLEKLNLMNQRSIKSINLSYWKELEKCDCFACSKLEQVIGLDKLDKNKNVSCSFQYCDRLSDVPNFKQFVLDHNHNTNSPSIVMPLNSYNFLLNEHPEWKNDDSFINNETCVWNDGLFVTTTKQTQMMKNRVDQIIDTICSPSDPSATQLYKAYQYICHNCKYDSEGLKLQRSGAIDGQETDINNPNETLITKDLCNQIRSAYFALWDNKAVCVGISNLFNFISADLGFKTESVACLLGDLENNSIDRDLALNTNHQISKITLGGVDYFFDPTNDLKKEDDKSDYARFFGLFANQYLSRYNLQFDMENINARSQNAPVNFENPLLQFYLREGIVDDKQFDYQKYTQYFRSLPTDIWNFYIDDVYTLQKNNQEQSLER